MVDKEEEQTLETLEEKEPEPQFAKEIVSPEDIEKAGYDNLFKAIVITSKWAREINLERKRKQETGKILEEFNLEEFSPPTDKEQETPKKDKKVTVEALHDLVSKKIQTEEEK